MSPQNLIPYLQYRNPTNTRLNRQIILTKNWSRALVLPSSKAKRPLDLCKQTGINKPEDTRRQSLGETKLRSCLCLCTHVHVLWTCTCVCQSTSVCVYAWKLEVNLGTFPPMGFLRQSHWFELADQQAPGSLQPPLWYWDSLGHVLTPGLLSVDEGQVLMPACRAISLAH